MVGNRRRTTDEPRARLVFYKGRSIGIRWRAGNRYGEVSVASNDRDDAVGEKAILLSNLRQGIYPNAIQSGPAILWKDFRERYETEHLPHLSEGSWSAWTTSSNWLEKKIKPRRLADVDKTAISRFQGMLAEEGLSPCSVATYLRTIRASLGWAYEMDLVRSVPKVRARKGLKTRKQMRSRPITGEEFDRIIAVAERVRPKDYADWQHFLRGLRLSSLRVDELRRLRWDGHQELCMDLSGKYPMIRMLAEEHKSRADCYQPITPEFWKLISATGRLRTGHVFPLAGRKQQMTRKAVIRVVSKIGEAAGVITDIASEKTATSHDIGRRAFLTQMATKLTLSQTQQFARHSDPRTTSQFYIRHEAEALAEAVGWE
jgi:integrase